jgi:hypothetical protein
MAIEQIETMHAKWRAKYEKQRELRKAAQRDARRAWAGLEQMRAEADALRLRERELLNSWLGVSNLATAHAAQQNGTEGVSSGAPVVGVSAGPSGEAHSPSSVPSMGKDRNSWLRFASSLPVAEPQPSGARQYEEEEEEEEEGGGDEDSTPTSTSSGDVSQLFATWRQRILRSRAGARGAGEGSLGPTARHPGEYSLASATQAGDAKLE